MIELTVTLQIFFGIIVGVVFWLPLILTTSYAGD